MKKILMIVSVLFLANSFGQNTILWSVKKNGSSNISYLLGTYHQMGNSYVDSLKTIIRTLNASELAIFENIDTGEGIAKYLNNRNDNYTYRDKLDKSHVKYLEEISQNWSVPVSKLSASELLMKIQQTYFETQCGTVKNTDSVKNFDNYLIKLAKRNSIALYGLESDSLITSYINQARNPEWKNLKTDIYLWLDNIKMNKGTTENCAFVNSYKKQHLDYQLGAECEQSLLISSRSKVWMPLIETKISSGNYCFIAVGFSHLCGKCGLIYKLRQSGYLVEPVYNLDR